nr:uncharacterized protein CTRU02_04548 [Colletotrichum truncatum]KAF6795738.1 hypothetical protein CTRU02_04548 [Colletotrichum truncatum]
MRTSNTLQNPEAGATLELISPVLSLQYTTQTAFSDVSIEKQDPLRQQSLAERRHRPRPEDIAIAPLSPDPTELSTIRLDNIKENQAESYRNRQIPLCLKALHAPRILLSTKTFRWVKMNDGVWVKVKRRRIVFITRSESRDGADG